MPVVGLEPTRVISPTDFESVTSAIPSHRHILLLSYDTIKNNGLQEEKLQNLIMLYSLVRGMLE